MRLALTALLTATLTTTGCLSSIIPEHTGGSSDMSTAGGNKNDTAQGGTGTGGNSTGGSDMGTDDAGTSASANEPGCINTAAPVIDGHHNEGQACGTTCHAVGGGQTVFTFSGTVYDKAAGGTGVGGVTVEVVDSKGVTVQVVTAKGAGQGNFWSTTALTPPLVVRSTACPANRAMVAKAATGNCNSAGCHDANLPIHVP